MKRALSQIVDGRIQRAVKRADRASQTAHLAGLMRRLRRHADRINAEILGAIAVAREAIPLMQPEQRAYCRKALREMVIAYKRVRPPRGRK